jgi:hypothetical protein
MPLLTAAYPSYALLMRGGNRNPLEQSAPGALSSIALFRIGRVRWSGVVEGACLWALNGVLAGVAGHSAVALLAAATRGARVCSRSAFAGAVAMGVTGDGEFVNARVRPPRKREADDQKEADSQQPEWRR